MKKQTQFFHYFALLLIFLSASTGMKAQSTTSGLGAVGHNVLGFPAINWSGWDAATPIPFNIEHRGTRYINFITGGTQRMVMKGTLVPATAGFVGTLN